MESNLNHQETSEPRKSSVKDEIIARLSELLREIDSPPGAEKQTPTSETEAKTNFGKVKEFFELVNNKPSSTTEIRVFTGITRGGLSNLLYLTHKASFVSTASSERPGKKLWQMKYPNWPGAASARSGTSDFAKLAAHECCRRILIEHNNTPMHVLTLAKEAVRRGYKGRGRYTGDALEWVAAKSFWARLSRTNKHDFEQIESNVFRLRNPNDKRTRPDLFGETDEEKIEEGEE